MFENWAVRGFWIAMAFQVDGREEPNNPRLRIHMSLQQRKLVDNTELGGCQNYGPLLGP